MNLLLALAVGLLFGCGALLLLERDLLRQAGGVLLMSHGANLFLMASALIRGHAPIHPVDSPDSVSDPIVQALTLTAVVITAALLALVLALVLRIHETHGTVEVDAIHRMKLDEEVGGGEPGGDG